MGFFLVKDQLHPKVLNDSYHNLEFCVLKSNYIKNIFNFDEASMHVHTEMYNVLLHGEKDFLPAGQTCLPKFLFSMFFDIFGFLFVSNKDKL